MQNLYIVKYTGPFGFIKPWTAVRDSETYSQQFLTPSIVAGIERKLFPELLKNDEGEIKKIVGHRVNYRGITIQQERTWPKGGIKIMKEKGIYKTKQGIINRGIMLEPHLYLAFLDRQDAEKAMEQTLCLCRNEDILYPESITEESKEKFYDDNMEYSEFAGFELEFTEEKEGFKVGYNRFKESNAMYGRLKIYGNPIRND